jgi:hypothetical protein
MGAGRTQSCLAVNHMSLRDIYETGYDEDSGRTTTTDDCPECTGTIRTVGGETTCQECGLIVPNEILAKI